MKKQAMYMRLVSSSFSQRKSRMALALVAVGIGAAVLAGLTSVYYDINQKMSREFRAYGANVVLAPSRGGEPWLPQREMEQAVTVIPGENLIGYAPYLYGIVRADKSRLVVVGTWFDQVRTVSPYWRVNGDWPARGSREEAMVGIAVADKLDLTVGSSLRLQDEITGNSVTVSVRGIITTGSTEDNQVFVDLDLAQELLAQAGRVNLAYLSVMARGAELEELAGRVTGEFPSITARPIQQISRSEGAMLEKIRSLVFLVVAVILLATLLSVVTTMMAMVMERRREIGLKKALGAQNRSIALEFLGEGTLLGLVGGMLGLVVGFAFAQVVGQSVFGTYISFRPGVIPLVLAVSLGVSALGCLIPVKFAAGVEPAVVLRGE
ncbi:hypothetical protein SY88_18340 [Clostridiales bacterium PH28_bin88]|nr:hypothetical protein SY88_18340 [Clostridiales bacterium PH28_bin88]